MNQLTASSKDFSFPASTALLSGVVVSPGAGVVLASSPAVSRGTYRALIWAGFDRGVPAPATETRNIGVLYNGGVSWILPVPGAIGLFGPFELVIEVTSPDFLTGIGLAAIAAGTLGVGYLGGMMLEKFAGGTP